MAITSPSSESSTPQPAKSRFNMSFQRVMQLTGGGLVALILLIFGGGFFWLSRDPQSAGNFLRTLRDLFLIVLALQSILITLALVILILQLANLVNLLQTEIKPLLTNLQETLNTAKGSAQFVGENLAAPLIKTGGFLAGASVFIREVGGLRRAVRRPDSSNMAAVHPDTAEVNHG